MGRGQFDKFGYKSRTRGEPILSTWIYTVESGSHFTLVYCEGLVPPGGLGQLTHRSENIFQTPEGLFDRLFRLSSRSKRMAGRGSSSIRAPLQPLNPLGTFITPLTKISRPKKHILGF
jgi:hypothetical protein